MKSNFQALLTVFSLLCSIQVSQCHLPTAVIDSGVLIGTTTSLPLATATVNKFLGIPFAASPPQRFSPPAPVHKFLQPLNVSAWKPSCVQQINFPEAARDFTIAVYDTPQPVESEDCLYLNVYAPSTPPPTGGFPVMFWIYGGSLQFGTASQPAYDGASFAAFQEVILVSINYRTNVFGFPNSPDLPMTAQNLGFLDQRMALEWVQSNIKSFGGNPAQVTIFGQSAGATSVDALVTSFTKNTPFRAAILESGTADLLGAQIALQNPGPWEALIASLNCTAHETDLQCARAAPATVIKSIIEHAVIIFPPVIDNITLVTNPEAARLARNVANVPILAGTDSQEGRSFEFGMTNLTAFVEAEFGAIGPAFINEVIEAYPVGTAELPTDFDAISQVFTEFIFQCPQAIMINDSTTAGFPTWRYYYNASFPNTQVFPGLGVYHGSEIGIVFGTFPTVGATAQQIALSNTMQGIWADFAKNPTKGPGWNRVGTFEGLDLANIGSDGSAGFEIIDPAALDERCFIFLPVYAALGRLV